MELFGKRSELLGARFDCGKVTSIYIVNMVTGIQGRCPRCELTVLQFVKQCGDSEENL